MSESTHLPSDDNQQPIRRRKGKRKRTGAAWEPPAWAQVGEQDDTGSPGRAPAAAESAPSKWQRAGKAVQRQLMVGEENDPAEREADRVADAVADDVPAAEPVFDDTASTDPAVDTTDADADMATGSDEESAVDLPAPAQAPEVAVTAPAIAGAGEQDEEPVQMAPMPGRGSREPGRDAVTDDWEERVDDSLVGGGRPLSDDERAAMERRTGVDLSGVRVHDDAQADTAARSIGARAFTVGDDVAFRSGEYSPGTASGRRLLAHELTHVVQQRGGDTAAAKRTPGPATTPSAQRAGARTSTSTSAGGTAVVRRAIKPEQVAGELVGRQFELSISITVSGVSIKAGTKVTVAVWDNTSDRVTVTATGVTGRFTVAKSWLLATRTAAAGVNPYSTGIPTQAAAVTKNETDLAAWVATAAAYKTPKAKATFDAEKKRLEDLLTKRREVLNRKLIQETMFNRFDATIKSEVDAANKAAGFTGKDALDPNLVKAMIFQETEFGTSGTHLEDPPTHVSKTRFNLLQVIDSSGMALLTLMEREQPAIVSARGIGSLRSDLGDAQTEKAKLEKKTRNATEEARLTVLKTLSTQSWENFIWSYTGFSDAVNDLFAGTSPARNLDYDFWIHIGVMWLFEKKRSGMSWEAAAKAYNGSGKRAEDYKKAVVARAAGAAAAAKAGTPFIPKR